MSDRPARARPGPIEWEPDPPGENFAELAEIAPSEAGRAFWRAKAEQVRAELAEAEAEDS